MAEDDEVRYPRRTLWYKTFQCFSRTVLLPFIELYKDYHIEKYHPEKGNPMLLLHNHVMDLDFLLTAGGYRGYTRFIISDAMVRNPLTALIVEAVSDFIYRRKGQNADSVVKSVEATFDAGISLIMAPEGEETPNGTTAPVRKRTGQMIKDLNVDIITYRVEGGYFVSPVWAKNEAKGPVFGKVVKVHTKEELSKLSPDEINELIYNDIYINHYDWVKKTKTPYDRECRAEYMDRILYICPHCGEIGSLCSHVDTLSCSHCGYSVDVDEYGLFIGDKLYFDNLYDWDIWQKKELESRCQGWSNSPDEMIIHDDHVKYRVLEGNKPVDLDTDVNISMTFNEFVIKSESTDERIPLSDVKGIVLSANDVLGVNYGGRYYLFKSSVPMCCRKYRTLWKVLTADSGL